MFQTLFRTSELAAELVKFVAIFARNFVVNLGTLEVRTFVVRLREINSVNIFQKIITELKI